MILDAHKDAEKRMKDTIEAYKIELQSIRAGRANPAILDRVTVDYYGQPTPVNQTANISAPEPRMLLIQPWDANLIPEIEKGILQADLGLNPSNDGKVIRISIPALTEERRKDLIKLVGKDSENAKVSVRNIRRDQMDVLKQMEKDKELSEDELRAAEEKMQEITDKYIGEIDKITEVKEAELTEI